jgi:hypothetical protein
MLEILIFHHLLFAELKTLFLEEGSIFCASDIFLRHSLIFLLLLLLLVLNVVSSDTFSDMKYVYYAAGNT